MASSSTSSVQKSFEYDVFLSFRGKDTRTNFVDHLYSALNHKSIRTYKDDERIKKGKRISDELIGSIQDSKLYIIVFSKNYASSSWCLDELVKIMECHKTTEHTAYPVFYDVEPSEVRKQSGAVEEALAKHKNEEAAGKWRDALKEAADLAGWELKNTADGHEAKFIRKIVEEISLELRSINLSGDGKLVGMETRVKDVVSSLEIGIDDVRMIGIKGMGGGGKTTLARAVFDQISFQFEGKSFVENVRVVSNASLSGLKSLQNQILLDVLNDQDTNITSVYEGKAMIKRMMSGREVLVVLDDVDHIDQLEALAGEPNWFESGSRIIITTRDEQVLVAHGVKLIRNVNLLLDKEAICLFSRHAFGKEIPIQGYEELSLQVVRYAAGLPLTIRVLGSFLCGKHELEWVDALERLKTIPLKETLTKLEFSYNGLEEDYKEIFLDVACILKGRGKDEIIEALESCGFHARNGLRVLEQKSLITIVNWRVDMHDHIEEMARNIVRRSHPDGPNKHSRLWINQEIEDILANDLGTEATRSMTFHMRKLNSEIVMKGLRKMKELRVLHVNPDYFDASKNVRFSWSWKFSRVGPYLPDTLRYLSWNGYPNRYLPATFKANNLVTLKIVHSKIVQLWEGGERKVLNKLRFLDLRHSMLRTLDLGLTPNLEMLTLGGCGDLVELHIPIACLKLRSVDLSGSKLSTLELGPSPNLESLCIKNCYDLVELHIPDRCLKLISLTFMSLNVRTLDLGLAPNLETLIIDGCDGLEIHMPSTCLNLRFIRLLSNSKLRTLDLGLTPNLETLIIGGCGDLVELHMSVACLKLRSVDLSSTKLRTLELGLSPNLERLDIKKCYDLVELHIPDGCQKLKFLNFTRLKVMTLDLGSALSLEKLILDECKDLVELHLPSRCPSLRSLLLNNSRLRTLNLGLTPNLEYLGLKKCYYLEELHMSNECQKLASLDISHSKLKTLDLRLTPNLKKLDLYACYNLVLHSHCIGFLKKLVYLNVSGCLSFKPLLFEIRDGRSCRVDESLQVGPLAELHLVAESLKRCRFHPENISPKFQFTCFYKEDQPLLTRNLEKLISVGMCACTNIETFSRSICGLQQLRKLKIRGSILEVHEDLGQLECLEELSFLSTKIKHLPDSICMLKHLKSLELISCRHLGKLPEDLGRLECLEDLDLSYTKIKHLPDSICMLKHLKYLELVECSYLEKLPDELGQLECLEELTLSSTKIKHLPDSICMLKCLEFLELKHCTLLEKLPEDLGQLECLETLILRGCEFLQDIPNSICKMKCLKVLDLEGTCISHLPQGILLLKGLRIKGSRGLL